MVELDAVSVIQARAAVRYHVDSRKLGCQRARPTRSTSLLRVETISRTVRPLDIASHVDLAHPPAPRQQQLTDGLATLHLGAVESGGTLVGRTPSTAAAGATALGGPLSTLLVPLSLVGAPALL